MTHRVRGYMGYGNFLKRSAYCGLFFAFFLLLNKGLATTEGNSFNQDLCPQAISGDLASQPCEIQASLLSNRVNGIVASHQRWLSNLCVLRELGTGADATALLVQEKDTGRKYVYKIQIDPNGKSSFEKEAAIAKKAGELGVGPQTEFIDFIPAIRMDYVEGVSLRVFRDEIFPEMTPAAQNRWLENFITAFGRQLSILHKRGRIIHFDLKPDNILLIFCVYTSELKNVGFWNINV